jgi:hypothetical protein
MNLSNFHVQAQIFRSYKWLRIMSALLFICRVYSLGLDKIESCYKKAMDFKKGYFDPLPQIKKHVHLLFTSTVADLSSLKLINSISLVPSKRGLDASSSTPTADSEQTDESKNTDPSNSTQHKSPQKPTKPKKVYDFSGCRFLVTSFDKIKSEVILQEYVPTSDKSKNVQNPEEMDTTKKTLRRRFKISPF